MGGKRETFWKLTPQEIQIDYEAYKRREQKRAQERWEMGAYIKAAINSSIFACVLADKGTPNKLSPYPEMPFKDETEQNNDTSMTEKQIEAERLKAYIFFQNLKKQN